jgi:hypothetical protein
MAIIKPNNNTISAITALPAAITTGKVLQVVSATYDNQTSNGTGGFVDSGLTVTITPSNSSSKVYIAVCQQAVYNTSAAEGVTCRLLRGSTTLCDFARYASYSSAADFDGESCNFLDTPSTTSATTYKVQFASSGGGGTVVAQSNSSTSSIVAMEIAG